MIQIIRRLFKRDPQKRNIYHSDYSDLVEYVFSVEGVKYYRFKQAVDMRQFRKIHIDAYIEQYKLGMNFETLLSYIDVIEDHSNKGRFGDTLLVIKILKERLKVNQNLDILYNISSVCYFTDDEDLENYKPSENKKKIESFKKSKDLAFFLTSPMTDIFPRLSSFTQDSGGFLKMVEVAEEMTKQLDSLVFSLNDKDLSMINLGS